MSLTHSDALRAADAIDAAMKVLHAPSPTLIRRDLWEALEAAGEHASHERRAFTWERVRYLAGFCGGVRTPLYELMEHAEDREGPYATPYRPATVPTFSALLGCLNNAAGAFA